MIKKRESFLIWAASFVFLTALQWNTRFLSYYGDELAFYIPLAEKYFRNFFDLQQSPGHFEFIHPPLYFALTGIITQLIGWSTFHIRLICFATSSLYMAAAYQLFCRIESRLVSVFAVISMLFCPVLLSQTSLYQAEVLTSTMILLSLLSLLDKRFILSSFFFVLATLTNITAWAFAPIFMLALRLAGHTSSKLKIIAAFFLPSAIGLGLWALYYVRCGGILPFTSGDLLQSNLLDLNFLSGPSAVTDHFWTRFLQITWSDGRWILSIGMALAILVPLRSSNHSQNRMIEKGHRELRLILVAFVVTELIFLSLFGYTLQRYFIVILPMVFALFLIQSKTLPSACVVALLCLHAFAGYLNWTSGPDLLSSAEDRYLYREIIQLDAWADQQIRNDPNGKNTITIFDWDGNGPSQRQISALAHELDDLDENKSHYTVLMRNREVSRKWASIDYGSKHLLLTRCQKKTQRLLVSEVCEIK